MTNLIFVQYGIADPRHQHHDDEEGNKCFPRHIYKTIYGALRQRKLYEFDEIRE